MAKNTRSIVSEWEGIFERTTGGVPANRAIERARSGDVRDRRATQPRPLMRAIPATHSLGRRFLRALDLFAVVLLPAGPPNAAETGERSCPIRQSTGTRC